MQDETPNPPGNKKTWDYTDFHLKANVAPQEETEQPQRGELANDVEQRFKTPVPDAILENKNRLTEEHRYLYHLRRGDYGPISPATRQLAAQRHALVTKALISIEHGALAPVRPSPEHFHIYTPADRSEKRAAILADYKSALDCENDPITEGLYFASMTAIPKINVHPYIRWLLRHEEIRIGINLLRKELCRYQVMYLENWSLAHPKDRVEEIKSEIGHTTDPEKIRAMQEELATLLLPTSLDSARSVHLALREAWEPCQAAIQMVVQDCIAVLQMKKEAIALDEVTAFIDHPMGLEPQPSVASKSLDEPIKAMARMLEKRGHHSLPGIAAYIPHNAEQTILSGFFGLSIFES